jgi:hypothetical protein
MVESNKGNDPMGLLNDYFESSNQARKSWEATKEQILEYLAIRGGNKERKPIYVKRIPSDQAGTSKRDEANRRPEKSQA